MPTTTYSMVYLMLLIIRVFIPDFKTV